MIYIFSVCIPRVYCLHPNGDALFNIDLKAKGQLPFRKCMKCFLILIHQTERKAEKATDREHQTWHPQSSNQETFQKVPALLFSTGNKTERKRETTILKETC